jgi:site-specific recombinase XerD
MAFSIVTGKVVRDNTGASVEIPVLISPVGPIRPLIDYCLSRKRSLSWQEKLVRAVKLFLEYLQANATNREEDWRIFRNFANALHQGTINSQTREDPSKLFWNPINVRDANYMITLLSDFLDWIGRDQSPRAKSFNPQYVGNIFDQQVDRLAYNHKRSKAFLGHAWAAQPKVSKARLSRSTPIPKVFGKRPPDFPEDKFEELLFRGFKVAGRYDYRGILITLLLHGGGLRLSEAFHIFMTDIQPHWDDSSLAFVAVHHPSLGAVPDELQAKGIKAANRAEYLSRQFGLKPRDLIRGNLMAGWKHPALDERWFMQVHWFPTEYGQLFMRIWKLYLEQVVSITRNHPYAWINLSQSSRGTPYTLKQYQKALQRAVERIGLISGKGYGTTAHGFRHAYAQRARRAGIHEVIIQRIMHHCSPESQKIYTEPETEEVRQALASATSKTVSGSGISLIGLGI